MKFYLKESDKNDYLRADKQECIFLRDGKGFREDEKKKKGNAMCKRTDNCTYLTVSALQDDALHSVFISRFTFIAGHFLF